VTRQDDSWAKEYIEHTFVLAIRKSRLTVAEYLQADICLASTDINPSLCEAAVQRKINVRIIDA
jgi:hypothetical protein